MLNFSEINENITILIAAKYIVVMFLPSFKITANVEDFMKMIQT
jgi:hypothetical protein